MRIESRGLESAESRAAWTPERRRPVLRAAVMATLLGIAGTRTALADTAPEAAPLNHAHAIYLGTGLYVAAGRSVFVLRIAPKVTLRPDTEDGIGVRLRLNSTVGLYDFRPTDFGGLNVGERVGSLALAPGLEVAVSAADNWTLIPFADVGLAAETELDDTVTVWGVGLRSRAHFTDGPREYVLRNKLIGAGSSGTELTRASTFVVVDTDFEIRGLLDFRLGRRELDLGLLARSELYLDPVEIAAVTSEAEEIRQRWELGLTIGSRRCVRLFGREVAAPRLGLAYRFGQGVSGMHLLVRWNK